MPQGVSINKSTRNMLISVLFIALGIGLIFNGILELVIEDHSQKTLTDAEVIERAKELGMVDMKEKITNQIEESEKGE